jgi:hypothetical protein
MDKIFSCCFMIDVDNNYKILCVISRKYREVLKQLHVILEY